MTITVEIKSERQELPKYKTSGAAGMDLYAHLKEAVTIKPGEIKMIPTGFSMALPQGFEGQIRARSGLATKHGITLVNGIGTIDSDYRGEVKIGLINLGKEEFLIEDGHRIAQLVVAKYEQVQWLEKENLEETQRGKGGFGHTGK